MQSRRRVVITGRGVLTPLGHDVPTMFASLLEGKSGVDWIKSFDAATFPTRFAAEVKGFDLSKYVADHERFRHSGVNTRFALAAAKDALSDAGLLSADFPDRSNFGIYLGSGEGTHEFYQLVESTARSIPAGSNKIDYPTFCQYGLKLLDKNREYEMEMHTTAGHLAEVYDLEGPNYTCLTACAASSQAIGEATEMIRRGDASIMLSGGSHSMIHPFGVSGFNLLTALSTFNENPQKASKPFDLNRDGFVLGEGAGMVVLEEYEHAKKRGATIYAEITGYGTTADAYRMTDSPPDGRGAASCVAAALKNARLNPSDIGYINAHGTSTHVNDRAETLGVKTVFGPEAYKVPISSSKSMLGHMIAAGGVVELIISITAMHQGVLPPTINYETPDPECDLDYIPNVAREKRVRHILTNSFGFGGQNISLTAGLI